MAKNIFNEIGATYKVIELDEHNDGRSLQEALARMTGARTVRRTSCLCSVIRTSVLFQKLTGIKTHLSDSSFVLAALPSS